MRTYVCVRACVRACVRVHVHVCVCVCVCVCVSHRADLRVLDFFGGDYVRARAPLGHELVGIHFGGLGRLLLDGVHVRVQPAMARSPRHQAHSHTRMVAQTGGSWASCSGDWCNVCVCVCVCVCAGDYTYGARDHSVDADRLVFE